MDEYLFIEWAKLQADRRKLEREEREALRAQQAVPSARDETSEAGEARGFSRALQWRAQS